MRERLQKLIARAGIASRRAAEGLILEGRVTVNGEVVRRLGSSADPERDAVKVDGKRLPAARRSRTYLMLHKPRGFVTTLKDPEGRPSVRDLLRGIGARVFPVGRLDYASEGLLLVTDDGDLARDLMHPASAVPKTYLAKVRGDVTPADLSRLRHGVPIEGRPTLPARARVARSGRGSATWVEIVVVEGRKHQVRRMLESVGHPVSRLRRVAYGGVELGTLRPGQVRELTGDEVERLRVAARGPRGGRRRADFG